VSEKLSRAILRKTSGFGPDAHQFNTIHRKALPGKSMDCALGLEQHLNFWPSLEGLPRRPLADGWIFFADGTHAALEGRAAFTRILG